MHKKNVVTKRGVFAAKVSHGAIESTTSDCTRMQRPVKTTRPHAGSTKRLWDFSPKEYTSTATISENFSRVADKKCCGSTKKNLITAMVFEGARRGDDLRLFFSQSLFVKTNFEAKVALWFQKINLPRIRFRKSLLLHQDIECAMPCVEFCAKRSARKKSSLQSKTHQIAQ